MCVVLNGRAIEPDSSILSLALYGYACFTTFTIENGAVKGLGHHLARLSADAEAIFGIRPEEKVMRKNVLEFLRQCGSDDGGVVRITVFPADFSVAYPENIAGVEILVTGRSAGFVTKKPLSLATVRVCRTLPLQKSANMIANLRARAVAREKGYDDALMICNEVIVEGPTWNIFFQKGDVLITPELESGVLPGVTRRLIVNACREIGTSVLEERISVARISEFDCCFASNSVRGLICVESIDGHVYAGDRSKFDSIAYAYAAIPGERI